MRIAHVLWIPWETFRGGGEEYTESLCKYLALREHDVILISPPAELQADIGKTRHIIISGLERNLRSLIVSASKLKVSIGKTRHIIIRSTIIRRMISGLAMLLWSLNIPRVLNKVNPDVILSHNVFPPFFCQKWASEHRKLFINVIHDVEIHRKEPIVSWKRYFFKLNLWLSHSIYVVVSNSTERKMKQFKKRVFNIGMGWNRRRSLNLPKENIVLYLGRIDKEIKNVPLLLRAWKEVNHNGWRLIVAGDGPDYDYCVNYARNIRLTDYEFLGDVKGEEKWRLYSRAKIFAFPSVCEGFGIVLLEAMSEGCIPIVNDTPPMNEIVTPEIGFITTPTVNGWVKALSTAMNFDLSKKRCQISNKIWDKYRWDDVVKRLEQIIRAFTKTKECVFAAEDAKKSSS
jgi:glycosyltransferase involved in cell wall biosynthesis